MEFKTDKFAWYIGLDEAITLILTTQTYKGYSEHQSEFSYKQRINSSNKFFFIFYSVRNNTLLLTQRTKCIVLHV